jgi:hypothetical protein
MSKLKWTRWLGAVALMAAAPLAIAADHRDADSLLTDPATDINDVYAWMNNGKVTMVMTVFPLADTTAKFSDSAKYVFHTRAGASGLAPSEPEINVIAKFNAAGQIELWVGDKDYIPPSDASVDAGVTSDSGMVKVFAGLRDDPFFFNLDGFNNTINTVKAAASTLTFDAYGCPELDPGTAATLGGLLTKDATGANPGADFFAGKNTLSIVVELEASLITTATAQQVTIWSSTNE